MLPLVSSPLNAVRWLCMYNERECICVSDISYLRARSCSHSTISAESAGMCGECNDCLCMCKSHILCNYERASCPSSVLHES